MAGKKDEALPPAVTQAEPHERPDYLAEGTLFNRRRVSGIAQPLVAGGAPGMKARERRGRTTPPSRIEHRQDNRGFSSHSQRIVSTV